jgi:hypothetical protein
VGEAIEFFDKVAQGIDKKSGWALKLAERALAMKASLLANPSEAKTQLEIWESETVRNLGLEEFQGQETVSGSDS